MTELDPATFAAEVCDVPEADLRVLPDVAGLGVVEPGGGTAHGSARPARLGARREHGPDFLLLHASAEDVRRSAGRRATCARRGTSARWRSTAWSSNLTTAAGRSPPRASTATARTRLTSPVEVPAP